MTEPRARTTPSEIARWLSEHRADPRRVDTTDMLTYVHEWEDAHADLIESAQSRATHAEEIERAWREAFEASRLTAAVEITADP